MAELKIHSNTLGWFAEVDGRLYGNSVSFELKRDLPFIDDLAKVLARDIRQCKFVGSSSESVPLRASDLRAFLPSDPTPKGDEE